jgi:hypothetical protein
VRDDGYYAPRLYEGLVAKPLIEFAASIDLNLDFTVLGVIKIKSQHRLNLAKFNAGIQFFASTKRLGKMCLQVFFTKTLLGLNHRMRTNTLKC